MDEMQSHLSSWREELERELLALEQQINDLRSAAADKRQKIDAIDRLLGDRPATRNRELISAVAPMPMPMTTTPSPLPETPTGSPSSACWWNSAGAVAAGKSLNWSAPK